ncbi:hypothetical protein [Bradyrhizobium sp. CCGUVB23]|uniref:hypothetical protein n=1 Tax=Bradyrhizobium sp. CCGUVB23 TaxID=2949630 RepID=UPI0020B3779E|nr:hypothetical protein [Bradyrhizobium sp. CCGUVB23]MCP3461985.1 hypothetical protein [Bradyrhizobium sp. CCGUVB23]
MDVKTAQAAGFFAVPPQVALAALFGMNGLVRVRTILLRFQVAKRGPQETAKDSALQHPDVVLVYQAPDQPCFVIPLELNAGSLYGDLVIAWIDSTP